MPTVWLEKVRLAGARVTVNAAGTVADTSFDLADSCAVGHAAPPEPLPLVLEEKVNVVPVGCPVEVKVPLKLDTELPPIVNAVPVGNTEQVAVQVTVAVVPLPLIVEMKPPTNDVSV